MIIDLRTAIEYMCHANGACNRVQGYSRPEQLYALTGKTTRDICDEELRGLTEEEREEFVDGDPPESLLRRAPVTHSVLNHLFEVM